MSLDKKNIIVTGGTGYIGSLLVARLKKMGANVLSLTSDKDKESKDTRYVDYRSMVELEKFFAGIDVVYHLASQTSAYVAESDPGKDLQVNIASTLNILESLSRSNSNAMFINASTATIYGMQSSGKVDDNDNEKAETFYEFHKKIVEDYVKFYSRREKIRGCSLRLSNVYGPGITEKSSDRGVINKICKNAKNGEDIIIYGTGEYIRDYIYVDDVVEAFVACATSGPDFDGSVFNICSGVGVAFNDVVKMIISKVDKCNNVSILYKNFPENALNIEKRNYIGNWSKINKINNWKPKISLSEGLNLLIGSLE